MKFIEQKRTHIPAKTEFIQRQFLDIQYAPSGERRTLDIYLPNEGEGPYPVVIDIFGGGWYFGNKSSHKLEPALALLRRGFAVVSINYSLSHQEKFPVTLQEVKASIRYVRKHAAEYELDADKIALLGESAGAHLASVAATSAANGSMIDPEWPNQDVSDEVQAVIAVYCPADLAAMKSLFAIEKQTMNLDTVIGEYGEADSMECYFIGGTINEKPELFHLANPESHINSKCPPFLFLHGSLDQVVPILGAMHFAAKIVEATNEDNVKFQIVEGAHHDIHDFEEEWIYDLEAEFLREKLHVGEK